jgi:carbon storage regulator CsrA
MLVLTRKRNEQIQIGDQVTITVLKVKGQSIQIGISAPQNVRIMRSELTQRGGPAERSDRRSRQQAGQAESEFDSPAAEPLDGYPVAAGFSLDLA